MRVGNGVVKHPGQWRRCNVNCIGISYSADLGFSSKYKSEKCLNNNESFGSKWERVSRDSWWASSETVGLSENGKSVWKGGRSMKKKDEVSIFLEEKRRKGHIVVLVWLQFLLWWNQGQCSSFFFWKRKKINRIEKGPPTHEKENG